MKIKLLTTTAISIAMLFVYSFKLTNDENKSRYRYKAVKLKTNGNCPDSIEASVYDAVTKDTLKYYFKTSGAGTEQQCCTVQADIKGSLVSGQIVDCSLKTIGIILLKSDTARPEIIRYTE